MVLQVNKRKFIVTLLFIFLIFILSPIVSVVITFLMVLIYKKSSWPLLLFVIFASLLLGVINSGKVPENDLVTYKEWFELTGKLSVGQYVLLMGKEPAYFIYSYLMYYLSWGNFEIFLIITTALFYSIVGYSYILVWKSQEFSHNALIYSLLILFLFSNLFLLSAHLIRQFIASSLVVYVVVNIMCYKQNKLWYFITAIFTHTSSLIFGFVYVVKEKAKFKKIIVFALLLSIVLIFMQSTSNIMLSILPDIDFIRYPFRRFLTRTIYSDLGQLGFLNFAIILFNLLIYLSFSRINNRVNVLVLFTIIILIVTLVFYNDTEIPMRMSFYTYLLFPLSFMYAYSMIPNKIVLNTVYIFFIAVLGMQFIFKLNKGEWEYENIERIIFGIISFI